MSSVRVTLPPMVGIVLLSLGLGSCSITETVNDILSSTTPSDWYSRDGLPKAEHKVDVFVAINIDNLKADLAKGQGEYLEAVSVLLAISPHRRPEFAALAQKEYARFAGQDQRSVAMALIALSRPFRNDKPV